MSLLAWRMALLAGECLAGGSLILLLAWLAARAAHHRASLRHLIWACAFGALLVLPLLAVLLPSRDVIALAPAPVTWSSAARRRRLRSMASCRRRRGAWLPCGFRACSGSNFRAPAPPSGFICCAVTVSLTSPIVPGWPR